MQSSIFAEHLKKCYLRHFVPQAGREQAAEGRPGGEGMADFIGWRVRLTFPLRGNVWSKPLDSGLRRNDEGVASGFCCHDERVAVGFYRNDEVGCGQAFVRHGKGVVGMAINPFRPYRHSSEGSPTRMHAYRDARLQRCRW